MGKGGAKQPTNTTTNVNQSALPEYAKPYFMELMQGAQGLATTPYTPYGGQRIADFTPAQQWAMGNQMNAQSPQEYNMGTDVANAAAWGSMQAAQYNPNSFYAQQVYGPQYQNYQMSGPNAVQGQGYALPSRSMPHARWRRLARGKRRRRPISTSRR